MAQKTNKKTVRPAVKKATAKPAVKKTVKKVAPVMDAPVVHECHCGGHCCCHGHHFIEFCIKLLVLCFVFLLGCIASPWVFGKFDKPMMKHIKYDNNGCVMMDSVKCPKMAEKLMAADENADGCITKVELKKVFKEMHHGKAHMPHPMPRMEGMEHGFEHPAM